MEEFRVQTSTYAPEFGRTPGGQISILTRSGTNQFHGTVFEYLRNDVLDANNWFNGYTNNPPLPKARERQNDFGGTFAGPIIRNKTFFFFSYEGLRLRLPGTELTTVPDLAARQNAVAAMQPYLKAFSLPNGTDDPASAIAQFNASFSDPASLDAYSLRVDHRVKDKLNLFARYSYSDQVPFLARNFGSFGVEFTYVLFDAGRRRAKLAESNAQLAQARENLARLTDDVELQVQIAYNKLQRTRELVNVSKELLDLRTEVSRVSGQQLEKGEALQSQAANAVAQKFDAQTSFLQAQLDYIQAHDEMAEAMGITPY